ncbi:hypothetical protein [Methylobacterium planeticum]|uniref:Class I SAM-dependent methyltransferase n=1 Tax=Methylobacterium planeticum TaxID=2615211 RepID=A0A6N6MMF5_9HYPH|nr:hypothetical protein [Methylobacterium planeticum]KAB1071021.1 hypothetical protein F6X51_20245 [Methylobacterium planeticum]
MLLELALYLTMSAPLRHRLLGHVRESVSLLARSRRCRAAWEPHKRRARAAIIAAFADLPRRRTAIVLGSGLLDDVPLRELAAAFDRVRLVDTVHPWTARLETRRYPQVDHVTADISGTRLLLGGGEDMITDADLTGICSGPDVDFVVSANLLSQLPILPIDWFEARGRPVPLHLGRRIVETHLCALARLPARVCLITDTLEREDDRAGRETDRLDLMHGAVLPIPDALWDWELAPFGEAGRDRRILHRVAAFRDWGSAFRTLTPGAPVPSS